MLALELSPRGLFYFGTARPADFSASKSFYYQWPDPTQIWTAGHGKVKESSWDLNNSLWAIKMLSYTRTWLDLLVTLQHLLLYTDEFFSAPGSGTTAGCVATSSTSTSGFTARKRPSASRRRSSWPCRRSPALSRRSLMWVSSNKLILLNEAPSPCRCHHLSQI